MDEKKFSEVKLDRNNPKWEKCISREGKLYENEGELREIFERDYNRILHSQAYRRLKHKTQVFFATDNDHVCTRIEHVNHVTAVSYTIAHALGLNTDLTNSIGIGHDIGHAPFGHEGEAVLKELMREELNDGSIFWHEKNSLRFADKIELLSGSDNKKHNLLLTYALRDGIVCHCGEVDENTIKPRDDAIDLNTIMKPGEYEPYTWEGCVVKIADKISYLGRDIEDAKTLKILSKDDLNDLDSIAKGIDKSIKTINTSTLINKFIYDLFQESSPEKGLCLSANTLELMNSIKKFNYERIYGNERLTYFKNYCHLVLKSLDKFLNEFYKSNDTIENLECQNNKINMTLLNEFIKWLTKYRKKDNTVDESEYKNEKIYDLWYISDYKKAIIDFIAGMTDKFAINSYEEIIKF